MMAYERSGQFDKVGRHLIHLAWLLVYARLGQYLCSAGLPKRCTGVGYGCWADIRAGPLFSFPPAQAAQVPVCAVRVGCTVVCPSCS